jgi:hypothetical protein
MQIGDRVIAIREVDLNENVIDEIGTIIYRRNESFLVEFDNNICGHSGEDARYPGKLGHCWWVGADELKLVSKINQLSIRDKILKNCQYLYNL